MRPIKKRLLCIVLILAMLPGMLLTGAPQASAAYENTYKNTGNQRDDLIGVALTQVGYREGSNNYTKYGEWYGSSHMAWCGAFVSWCANQAGIPTAVIRKNGWASASSFGLTDTWNASSGRLPRPGDLFFTTSNSHVGIVYYVEGNYFYTIEGNTNNTGSSEGTSVLILRRALTSRYYFAAPKYTTDNGHNYKPYYESAHPHKEYYYCDHCNDFYYTGRTTTSSSCTTCIQASCSHTYGSWSRVDDANHKRTCAKCGYIQTRSHSWNSGTVIKAATCKEAGSKKQTCSVCSAERTVTIEKLKTHSFGPWEYMDEQTHYHKCSVCGLEEKESHSAPNNWEYDVFDHWYLCTACEGKAGLGQHSFAEGCEEPCDTCQYLRPTGHLFLEAWTYDNSGHWHACENCSQRGSFSPHIFDAPCDETCAECEFTRVTDHHYSETFQSDASGHWYTCEDCGHIQQLIPHTPGPEATEQAAQVCLDCGYEIAPKLVHVHNFEPMSYDHFAHWGQCVCGEPYKRENHIWDVNTGTCTVCAMVLDTEARTVPVFQWYWLLPPICILAVACIVLIIILLTRSKKRKKEPVAV